MQRWQSLGHLHDRQRRESDLRVAVLPPNADHAVQAELAPVAGSAAVVTIAVLAALIGMREQPHHAAASPPPTESPTRAPSPLNSAVWTALVGNWAGRVRQPPVDVYHAELVIPATSSRARISYSIPGVPTCSMELIPISAR